MWQPIPFHSIHTPPCYTPVGSAHMIGNSAKPQEPVRFSVLLKDTDKGRVNTERSNYQDTLLNIFASQVSTAATVSLTPRSYPCWCEPCLQWYFVLKWITLHSHVNDLWMRILFGPPVFSSIFLAFFSFSLRCPSPELQLHWPHRPRSPCKEGNLTLHRKPVSLLLLAANGAAVF